MSFTYKPEIGSLSEVPNGSWYSDQDQESLAANTEYIMTCNNIIFERGIRLVDGSKFTVDYSGLFNLQFSAQLHNTDGGGSSAALEIWLKKNGSTLPYTGGKVSVTPNSPFSLPCWNYYIALTVGDYLQLAWATNTVGIHVSENTAVTPGSDIPSLIVTMTQVG